MSVTVNGDALDEEMLRKEERALRLRLAQAMPNETPAAINARAHDWARDNLIDQLLAKQALAADPNVFKEMTAKIGPPKQKEITEYYKKNRASLYRPAAIHAVHIIAPTQEAIEAVAAQLAAGMEFSAVEGFEDLGFFPRGRMAPEFESVVFAMKPGDTSPAFQTRFGFHIARVLAQRRDGIPELNEIQSEIFTRLQFEKHRRVVDRHVDQLRAKADIRIE